MQTRKGNDRGEQSHGGWRVRQAERFSMRFALTQTQTERQTE